MKKNIIIGAVIAVLIFVVSQMFIVVHHKSGAFKIPLEIKSDVPLTKVEYKTIYEGKSSDNGEPWKEIEPDNTGNYIARVSYVMIGSDLSDEENYTYANRIFIRLTFNNGSKLSVLSPLKFPDKNAKVYIDTTQQ